MEENNQATNYTNVPTTLQDRIKIKENFRDEPEGGGRGQVSVCQSNSGVNIKLSLVTHTANNPLYIFIGRSDP